MESYLVTCDANNINPEIKHNPVIYSSIRVWRDISKYVGREKRKSLLSHIIQNPDFPAGVSSSVFSAWRDKGVYVLDHLFKDNALMSFQQLQELSEIPKSHFFGYLQIRHFISSLANLLWDIFYVNVNMEWPGSQRKVQYRNR